MSEAEKLCTATPENLYAAVARYLESHGWRRADDGSGWWLQGETSEDATLADAFDSCLAFDGVDTREEPQR